MSDSVLFIWGCVAFALSVGPLTVAAILDYRERGHRRALEHSAGVKLEDA